jgi:hypothetical protein
MLPKEAGGIAGLVCLALPDTLYHAVETAQLSRRCRRTFNKETVQTVVSFLSTRERDKRFQLRPPQPHLTTTKEKSQCASGSGYSS